MNRKGLFTSIVVLLICFVVFNNCSSGYKNGDFKVLPSTCTQTKPTLTGYDPALELAAATQNAAAHPFRVKKISTQIETLSNNDDVVVLVSNKCLKSRSTNQLSSPAKKFVVEAGNENLEFWPRRLKKSDLNLSDVDAVREIESDPCIIGVGPNRTYSLSSYTAASFTDPLYSMQNTLRRLQFFDSLTYFYRDTFGIATVPGFKATVAVIDTGVNYTHLDLTANIPSGPNGYGVDAVTLGTNAVVYNGSDVDTARSHGTHVAGIVAAAGANALGISGVAPKGVQILPIRGFYRQNNALMSDTETISKAVAFAVESGADVINLSLGGDGDDPVFKAALISAVNSGVFISVAAGNESKVLSSTFKKFPAYYGSSIKGLMTVGSIDAESGSLSDFSNRSNVFVEIAAPGRSTSTVGVVSTVGTGNYSYLTGTSQASPHVAGAAALVIALLRENGIMRPTPAVIESLLAESAAKSVGLLSTVQGGNVLDLKKLGELVNEKYPQTMGGVCP